MKIAEAVRVVAAELASQRPVPVQIPAFSGLPDEIQTELRSILEPCQRAGLWIEVDPTIPNTVGILIHGGLYRVSAANNPKTGGMFVAVLGPDLAPWSKDEFLALLPDAKEEPAPPPLRLSDAPMNRPVATILENILEVQRDILAELRRR